jgi:hypothetical protein
MMKIQKTIAMLLGAWALTLTSCSTSDSPSDDEHLVRMPVNLAIPANDASLTAGAAGAKATRAEGDPGTYEKFLLPSHLYIYIVNTALDKTTKTMLKPEGMDPAKGYTLKPENWMKIATTDNNKDSIYVYTGEIRIIIPEDRLAGTVYAAMSTVPITVSYTGTDVEDAIFTLSDEAKSHEGEALKNLYSSPYNLKGADVSYYGIVNDYRSNNPHINMVLYHTAAKLDLQWNVDAKVQSTVKLSKIELTGLSGGGYLFKPLENTSASTSTYSETFSLDAGSQWYGRQATYVIPVNTNGSYLFPMTLTNSVSSSATPTKEATATVKPSSNAGVFVPWMVGTVKITNSW